MKGFSFRTIACELFSIVFLSSLSFASDISNNQSLGCMACHEGQSLQPDAVSNANKNEQKQPKQVQITTQKPI
jgi:hypothetical protein